MYTPCYYKYGMFSEPVWLQVGPFSTNLPMPSTVVISQPSTEYNGHKHCKRGVTQQVWLNEWSRATSNMEGMADKTQQCQVVPIVQLAIVLACKILLQRLYRHWSNQSNLWMLETNPQPTHPAMPCVGRQRSYKYAQCMSNICKCKRIRQDQRSSVTCDSACTCTG